MLRISGLQREFLKGYIQSEASDLLIDELKSDEIKRRVNSVKNLSTIAVALGLEKTKSELIPFLEELLDDEEEVLLALSESIPTLIDFVGGPNSYYVLLEPLEKLTQVEQVAIREKAMQSLRQILLSSDFKKNEEQLIAMIRRYVATNSQISKTCLASVIPAAYPQLLMNYALMRFLSYEKQQQSALRKDLVRLLPNISDNEMQKFFGILLKDDQDFVKVQLVDSIIAFEIAYAKNNQKLNDVVVPYIKAIVEDSAWRVRYTISDKIVELSENLGSELNKEVLFPHFISLLADPETEIRVNAASKVAAYAGILGLEDVIGKLVPAIKPLSTDTEPTVRASLASCLLQLCPIIGHKNTIEHILSIFLVLLKDEFSETRTGLLKHIEEIAAAIDAKTLENSLLPALFELACDKNWRTRVSCIEILPFIAKKMGKEFFSDSLAKVFLDWLTDKVFSVREAAVNCSRKLTETLGSSWAESVFLPKMAVLQSNPNYLYRQSFLFIIIRLADLLTQEGLSKNILPLLAILHKDPIANVRMNAAKGLGNVLNALKDKTIEKEIVKKMLNFLTEDPDPDVSKQAKNYLQ